MHCFLHFRKAQYILEKKNTLENIFFETELETDGEVSFVL